ncbi:MAG: hypothetical protein ACJ8FZ_01885, partial [Bradyrhizobium sp.]
MWNDRSRQRLERIDLDRAMNQRPAHDSQAALVSRPVNAMCLAPDGDQQRLVCLAEETPIAFRYDGFS